MHKSPLGKPKTAIVMVVLITLIVTFTLGCQPKPRDNPNLNVLHYFRTTDYKSLDPPQQFDAVSMGIINNVYDTLLEYHYLKRPYKLTPNLLAKMPELAEDKVTYTFILRQGIQFHDDPCFPDGKGRELTADDVFYTIKRFADVNINQGSYSVLLEGRIQGLDEFRAKTRQHAKKQKNVDPHQRTTINYEKENIEGLKKIDPYTFQIILTQPDSLALMPFASGALSIVPSEAVKYYGKKLRHNAVGTGPFILTQNDRRGEIVLQKNRNYHGRYPSTGEPGDEQKGLLSSAGKSLPLLDEVRMPLMEENQPRMLNFLKGRIDLIGIDRNNFTMAYKDDQGFHLKAQHAHKFQIYSSPSLSVSYYIINMKDPVLGQNKALRQAIAYAIDTPTYIDKMLNGRGQPLNTIVPAAVNSEPSISIQWYPPNLEKAKQKLVEAGYPNGQGLDPITIDYRQPNTLTRQNYEFTRAQLAKVGIELKGRFQTFSAFLDRLDNGNFQIADSGWQADYPDPENFLQLLYGPNNPPEPNAGAYQNAEYDRLYKQMQRMPSGTERSQVIAKMTALIKEEVPVIPTVNGTSVGMHQQWLSNVKSHAMLDSPLKFFEIDVAAKARGLKR